ncbi:Ribonuclease H-like domain containing protein [Forsythia ovata]|uniref:Ribonuclease H-like domain containing protein n=1 Tax=Forsythia ovata TaxID=205694 RepID=A0ABD1Q1R5_9LAMI
MSLADKTPPTNIRDEFGVVVAMQAKTTVEQLSPENTEAMAIQDGLNFARDRGFRIAEVECDSLRVIQSLKSDLCCAPNASVLLNIISSLREVSSGSCRFIPH